jgi:hypothetical protein
VVGQQTYEAPPSNSDVAGLSGGIRAAGQRAIKSGKITEDFIIISTTLFEFNQGFDQRNDMCMS